MKRFLARCSSVVFGLLSLSVSWLTPLDAATVTPSERVTDSISIRALPDGNSAIIGKLKRGETVVYLGELPNWYEVRTPGNREGYVHKGWTRFIDDSAPGASAEESPSTAAGTPQSGRLEIHFIDVGQGDSTLILCPNGNAILVDAGSSGQGSLDDVRSYILEHLDRTGRVLTGLVVTHPDLDHYNYLPEILSGVEVRHLFRTGTEEDFNKQFVAWLRTIPASRKHVLYKKDFDPEGRPNQKLACGDAKVHILAAAIPTTRHASNFIKNSLSTVLMIRHGRVNVILTGDATFDTEQAILDRFSPAWLKSEVLKIGHHGSRLTSTSEAWARTVRPKLAIASAGTRSAHGHPSEEVVQRLETFTEDTTGHPLTYARGTKPYRWIEHEDYTEAIYSTADSSTLVITSDGTTYTVKQIPF